MYISYDGLTDPLGQSQILPYLEGLTGYGYEFTVLSFEKKDRFKSEKKIVQEIIDRARIKWVPLLFTAKPPVLSKIYDRYRLRKAVVTLQKKEKFDMVHCRSYVAAEAGLILKKKYSTKFLFDMRGFWADEKADNGQWDLKKFLYREIYNHYKKREKEFLLNADGIVTLTRAAKDYLLSKPEYKHLSIEVIPCCADLCHFDYNKISTGDLASLRSSLRIPQDAKVITYLGSVGGWYMTREMFSFFRLLHHQHPEYRLLILTKDDGEQVKKEAGAAGITVDNIIVEYSTRKQLPLYLALSDCSIFFIRNTFSKMASSPTKHAELMGMGIPVICNDIGDTGNIVHTTKTGIVTNDFSDSSLSVIVNQVKGLENINKEVIRNYAKDIFDLQAGIKKYLSAYKKTFSE